MTSVRSLRPRLCELWPLPGIDAPRESGPVTLRSVALAMRPISRPRGGTEESARDPAAVLLGAPAPATARR